jgi:hypothetical protein
MKVENFETDDIESAIQITPFANETGLCDNRNWEESTQRNMANWLWWRQFKYFTTLQTNMSELHYKFI